MPLRDTTSTTLAFLQCTRCSTISCRGDWSSSVSISSSVSYSANDRVGVQMSRNRQRRLPSSTSHLRSSGSSSGSRVSHSWNRTAGLRLIREKRGAGRTFAPDWEDARSSASSRCAEDGGTSSVNSPRRRTWTRFGPREMVASRDDLRDVYSWERAAARGDRLGRDAKN
jgi:hypothetical protein